MLSGLNHLTLAVSDLNKSIDFYSQSLGFVLHASWPNGAYLTLGELWLCLSLDSNAVKEQRDDYTHYAFSCDITVFPLMVTRLKQLEVIEWKVNKSEGDSFYFLDPDRHRLEIHVGDLKSRLTACRMKPYAEMVFHTE
ncbi:hypothetical protein HMPREF1487_09142 [Pseudomonas sp. HPB0071]|uniref:VOC family protein n=1 Tax=unclassified Pseudomonas TaxID=196821 RepID=UPI0002CA9AA6|nr:MULTISPECIES: VOC family protein [unclassified Pseudomonas]ENA27486.1 hypothetical protein HMPREF1487_09142 [Pseudomonas sp. HPB0071]